MVDQTVTDVCDTLREREALLVQQVIEATVELAMLRRMLAHGLRSRMPRGEQSAAVLRVLSEADKPLRNKEIAAMTGIVETGIGKILARLAEMGFCVRVAVGRWIVTPKEDHPDDS